MFQATSCTPITPQTIEQFAEDLERKTIVCSKKGWKTQGTIAAYVNRIWEWLWNKQHVRLKAIGECFAAAMDELEHSPVLFGEPDQDSQTKCYENYLKTADRVIHLLKTSPKLCHQMNEVAVKVAALKYRIEACHAGLDPSQEVDSALYQRVASFALQWKKEQGLFKIKDLTQDDLNKITRICSYPEFAKVLVNDKMLQGEFFKWAFRDNNGVDQFVQFPAMCSLVKKHHIACRVGYFGGKGLSIAKIPSSKGALLEKVIQLPFYNGKTTEQISILDSSRKVTLNGDWTLSIKEIFERFANKKQEPRHVEYVSAKGMMNWNAREQGVWDPRQKKVVTIDLNDPQWIKQLPVHQALSQSEVHKKYEVELDKDEWLLVYRATRESADLWPSGCHGYLEIVMPSDEGKYLVYPFGKYAERIPDNMLGLMQFVDNTVLAKLAYPDENIYYSQRQQAFSVEKLSCADGVKFLELIRQELHKALQKNTVFQLRSENCAYWVQDLAEQLHESKPMNLYKVNVMECGMFAPLKKLSQSMQLKVIKIWDFFLGAHRARCVVENGKVVSKSVSKMPDQSIMYHPGNLHVLIEKGELRGKIYAGHAA